MRQIPMQMLFTNMRLDALERKKNQNEKVTNYNDAFVFSFFSDTQKATK